MADIVCILDSESDDEAVSFNEKVDSIEKIVKRITGVSRRLLFDCRFSPVFQQFPYHLFDEFITAVEISIAEVKRKITVIDIWNYVFKIVESVKKLFGGEKELKYDYKYNLLLIKLVSKYVNFKSETIERHISYKTITADELDKERESLYLKIMILFDGYIDNILMLLMKIDVQKKFDALLYPIFKKILTEKNIYKENDFISYVSLILCYQQWKKLTLISSEKEQLYKYALKILPATIPQEYKESNIFKGVLPNIPTCNKKESTRFFLRCKSLDCAAIEKFFNAYESFSIELVNVNSSSYEQDDGEISIDDLEIDIFPHDQTTKQEQQSTNSKTASTIQHAATLSTICIPSSPNCDDIIEISDEIPNLENKIKNVVLSKNLADKGKDSTTAVKNSSPNVFFSTKNQLISNNINLPLNNSKYQSDEIICIDDDGDNDDDDDNDDNNDGNDNDNNGDAAEVRDAIRNDSNSSNQNIEIDEEENNKIEVETRTLKNNNTNNESSSISLNNSVIHTNSDNICLALQDITESSQSCFNLAINAIKSQRNIKKIQKSSVFGEVSSTTCLDGSQSDTEQPTTSSRGYQASLEVDSSISGTVSSLDNEVNQNDCIDDQEITNEHQNNSNEFERMETIDEISTSSNEIPDNSSDNYNENNDNVKIVTLAVENVQIEVVLNDNIGSSNFLDHEHSKEVNDFRHKEICNLTSRINEQEEKMNDDDSATVSKNICEKNFHNSIANTECDKSTILPVINCSEDNLDDICSNISNDPLDEYNDHLLDEINKALDENSEDNCNDIANEKENAQKFKTSTRHMSLLDIELEDISDDDIIPESPTLDHPSNIEPERSDQYNYSNKAILYYSVNIHDVYNDKFPNESKKISPMHQLNTTSINSDNSDINAQKNNPLDNEGFLSTENRSLTLFQENDSRTIDKGNHQEEILISDENIGEQNSSVQRRETVMEHESAISEFNIYVEYSDVRDQSSQLDQLQAPVIFDKLKKHDIRSLKFSEKEEIYNNEQTESHLEFEKDGDSNDSRIKKFLGETEKSTVEIIIKDVMPNLKENLFENNDSQGPKHVEKVKATYDIEKTESPLEEEKEENFDKSKEISCETEINIAEVIVEKDQETVQHFKENLCSNDDDQCLNYNGKSEKIFNREQIVSKQDNSYITTEIVPCATEINSSEIIPENDQKAIQHLEENSSYCSNSHSPRFIKNVEIFDIEQTKLQFVVESGEIISCEIEDSTPEKTFMNDQESVQQLEQILPDRFNNQISQFNKEVEEIHMNEQTESHLEVEKENNFNTNEKDISCGTEMNASKIISQDSQLMKENVPKTDDKLSLELNDKEEEVHNVEQTKWNPYIENQDVDNNSKEEIVPYTIEINTTETISEDDQENLLNLEENLSENHIIESNNFDNIKNKNIEETCQVAIETINKKENMAISFNEESETLKISYQQNNEIPSNSKLDSLENMGIDKNNLPIVEGLVDLPEIQNENNVNDEKGETSVKIQIANTENIDKVDEVYRTRKPRNAKSSYKFSSFKKDKDDLPLCLLSRSYKSRTQKRRNIKTKYVPELCVASTLTQELSYKKTEDFPNYGTKDSVRSDFMKFLGLQKNELPPDNMDLNKIPPKKVTKYKNNRKKTIISSTKKERKKSKKAKSVRNTSKLKKEISKQREKAIVSQDFDGSSLTKDTTFSNFSFPINLNKDMITQPDLTIINSLVPPVANLYLLASTATAICENIWQQDKTKDILRAANIGKGFVLEEISRDNIIQENISLNYDKKSVDQTTNIDRKSAPPKASRLKTSTSKRKTSPGKRSLNEIIINLSKNPTVNQSALLTDKSTDEQIINDDSAPKDLVSKYESVQQIGVNEIGPITRLQEEITIDEKLNNSQEIKLSSESVEELKLNIKEELNPKLNSENSKEIHIPSSSEIENTDRGIVNPLTSAKILSLDFNEGIVKANELEENKKPENEILPENFIENNVEEKLSVSKNVNKEFSVMEIITSELTNNNVLSGKIQRENECKSASENLLIKDKIQTEIDSKILNTSLLIDTEISTKIPQEIQKLIINQTDTSTIVAEVKIVKSSFETDLQSKKSKSTESANESIDNNQVVNDFITETEQEVQQMQGEIEYPQIESLNNEKDNLTREEEIFETGIDSKNIENNESNISISARSNENEIKSLVSLNEFKQTGTEVFIKVVSTGGTDIENDSHFESISGNESRSSTLEDSRCEELAQEKYENYQKNKFVSENEIYKSDTDIRKDNLMFTSIVNKRYRSESVLSNESISESEMSEKLVNENVIVHEDTDQGYVRNICEIFTDMVIKEKELICSLMISNGGRKSNPFTIENSASESEMQAAGETNIETMTPINPIIPVASPTSDDSFDKRSIDQQSLEEENHFQANIDCIQEVVNFEEVDREIGMNRLDCPTPLIDEIYYHPDIQAHQETDVLLTDGLCKILPTIESYVNTDIDLRVNNLNYLEENSSINIVTINEIKSYDITDKTLTQSNTQNDVSNIEDNNKNDITIDMDEKDKQNLIQNVKEVRIYLKKMIIDEICKANNLILNSNGIVKKLRKKSRKKLRKKNVIETPQLLLSTTETPIDIICNEENFSKQPKEKDQFSNQLQLISTTDFPLSMNSKLESNIILAPSDFEIPSIILAEKEDQNITVSIEKRIEKSPVSDPIIEQEIVKNNHVENKIEEVVIINQNDITIIDLTCDCDEPLDQSKNELTNNLMTNTNQNLVSAKPELKMSSTNTEKVNNEMNLNEKSLNLNVDDSIKYNNKDSEKTKAKSTYGVVASTVENTSTPPKLKDNSFDLESAAKYIMSSLDNIENTDDNLIDEFPMQPNDYENLINFENILASQDWSENTTSTYKNLTNLSSNSVNLQQEYLGNKERNCMISGNHRSRDFLPEGSLGVGDVLTPMLENNMIFLVENDNEKSFTIRDTTINTIGVNMNTILEKRKYRQSSSKSTTPEHVSQENSNSTNPNDFLIIEDSSNSSDKTDSVNCSGNKRYGEVLYSDDYLVNAIKSCEKTDLNKSDKSNNSNNIIDLANESDLIEYAPHITKDDIHVSKISTIDLEPTINCNLITPSLCDSTISYCDTELTTINKNDLKDISSPNLDISFLTVGQQSPTIQSSIPIIDITSPSTSSNGTPTISVSSPTTSSSSESDKTLGTIEVQSPLNKLPAPIENRKPQMKSKNPIPPKTRDNPYNIRISIPGPVSRHTPSKNRSSTSKITTSSTPTTMSVSTTKSSNHIPTSSIHSSKRSITSAFENEKDKNVDPNKRARKSSLDMPMLETEIITDPLKSVNNNPESVTNRVCNTSKTLPVVKNVIESKKDMSMFLNEGIKDDEVNCKNVKRRLESHFSSTSLLSEPSRPPKQSRMEIVNKNDLFDQLKNTPNQNTYSSTTISKQQSSKPKPSEDLKIPNKIASPLQINLSRNSNIPLVTATTKSNSSISFTSISNSTSSPSSSSLNRTIKTGSEQIKQQPNRHSSKTESVSLDQKSSSFIEGYKKFLSSGSNVSSSSSSPPSYSVSIIPVGKHSNNKLLSSSSSSSSSSRTLYYKDKLNEKINESLKYSHQSTQSSRHHQQEHRQPQEKQYQPNHHNDTVRFNTLYAKRSYSMNANNCNSQSSYKSDHNLKRSTLSNNNNVHSKKTKSNTIDKKINKINSPSSITNIDTDGTTEKTLDIAQYANFPNRDIIQHYQSKTVKCAKKRFLYPL